MCVSPNRLLWYIYKCTTDWRDTLIRYIHAIKTLKDILNPKRKVTCTKKFTALFYKLRLHGLFAFFKKLCAMFLGQMPNLNAIQLRETFSDLHDLHDISTSW